MICSPVPVVAWLFFWDFVRLGIGDHRHGIHLAEPTSQIDRPAAIAAEWQCRRRGRLKLTITYRATHKQNSNTWVARPELPAMGVVLRYHDHALSWGSGSC